MNLLKNNLILNFVSLILTFVFADVLSIYSFGSIPTLLTILYLLSIFLILDYVLITGSYILKKLITKEKILIKKIIGLILIFIALILILLFLVVVNVDYLHWYMYSSPFYLNIIVRSLEFLLPAAVLLVIGFLLIKK